MPNIFTASSVRSGLMEANKDYMGRNIWEQAFQKVDTEKSQAINALNRSYGDTVAQAYLSSLSQKQGIVESNLGQGYKEAALNQNQLALNNAFESYKANYLASRGEIETGASQANEQINTALNAQAENHAAYANAALDYLPWLYEQNAELFESNPALQRYLEYGDDGTVVGLRNLRNELFDVNGNLTPEGVDFMNYVQAGAGRGDIPSGMKFSDYLYQSDKNRKLLEWLNEADQYNSGKTNAETFNEILGANGYNQNYQLSRESFTDKSLSNIQQTYENKHNELLELYNKGHKSEKNATAFMKKLHEESEILLSAAESLGIDSELLNKVRRNLDTYDDTIANPGKYNNRANREWATSNALGDYEDLYNTVMNNYDIDEFENAVSRRDKPNKLMELHDTGKISDDEYYQQISSMIDVSSSDAKVGKDSINISYSLSDDAAATKKERILLNWNKNYLLSDGESSKFKPVKSFAGSGRNIIVGVWSDTGDIAIEENGKIYRVGYLDSKHNKIFADYIKGQVNK